ncbi:MULTISPECIES: HlyD family secretion protein [Enterobacterales]|uniref:HlyD family secretion protein n=1 Tax=Enterobacterales TaxID=91347 RepID=UPI002ED93A3F
MGLFRKEVVESRRNAWLGEVVIISPPSLRYSAWGALAIVCLIVVFVCFFSYTKKQQVSGVLMPDKGIIKVFGPQPGLVKEARVKEGEKVAAGDVLVIISSDKSNQNEVGAQQNISEQIRTRLSLLKSTLSETELAWTSDKANTQNQINQLAQQVNLQEKQLGNQQNLTHLLNKRAEQYQSLWQKEYVSLEQLQRVQEESLRQNGTLSATRNEFINSNRELLQRKNELVQLESNYQKQLNDIASKITVAEQELTESESKREIVVRASESGTVTAVAARAGQYFDGRAPLLSIIPEGAELLAYLYAPSYAVGFIRENSDVWLRYPAWPWQKFGQYHGRVVSVSKVALTQNEIELFENKESGTPLYRIVVKPDSTFVNVYGEKMPLQAGMQLEADVLRERRRLYEWIFEPLLSIAPARTGG